MRKLKTIVVGVLWIALSCVATAHDFWIEPGTFGPASGEHLAIGLKVGDPFEGADVERRANHLRRFFVAGDGETQVTGRFGATPAGIARATGSGLHVVAYESRPNFHRMTPKRFAAYLEHAGLSRIRDALDSTARDPIRERFKRCARALIDVDQTGQGSDRAVGLPLELIAETNPYADRNVEQMRFVLLYRGEPLPGALVVATSAFAPDTPVRGRTDEDGVVSLALAHPGPWLATAVHMVESESADADWDSYWASLTFELNPDLKTPSDR